MRFRKKGWLWWLTIFASPEVFTTLGETIFGPSEPPPHIVAHERIHSQSQLVWGYWSLPFWIGLYLLALPLFFNPLRYRTEYEAYRKGSNLNHAQTKAMLRSWNYGFLPYWLHAIFVWDLKGR